MSYLAIALLFLALMIPVIVRARMRHARLKSACQAAFDRIYASQSPVPKLHVSYSYGFPAFQVMFNSKPALETAAAAGLNRSFTQEIAALCKDRGSKSTPFDADNAVFFTYEGWLEEQVAKDKRFLRERGHDA
jgi:hypothetical protein